MRPRATRLPFSELASKANDGSTINAIADYSSVSGLFQVVPAVTEVMVITRLIVSISDADVDTTGFYGDLAALTNGIVVRLMDGDDALIGNLTAQAIKANVDWATQCHDFNVIALANGDDWITVEWIFETPIILNGNQGTYIEVKLDDNMTGLVKHHFLFSGYFDNVTIS